MVLGTQWYILFNVIAGASAFPTDLREASTIYRLRTWQWWRDVILPGIFPYYVTGALTASGGSWNASIVAEVASWGDTKLEAAGLGAYIANATEAGDFPRVVLGIAVMSIFVVAFNRLVWRPLYRLGRAALPPELNETGPERISAMDTAVSTPAPAACLRPLPLPAPWSRSAACVTSTARAAARRAISCSRTSTSACAATRSSPCWAAPAAASPRCCASSPG